MNKIWPFGVVVSVLLLSCSTKDGKDDTVKTFVDSFADHLALEHVIVMSDYGCSGCKSLLFESVLSKNRSDTTLIITNINRTSNYGAYLEEGYTNLLLDTLDLALEHKVGLLYPVYYNRVTGVNYPLSIDDLMPGGL